MLTKNKLELLAFRIILVEILHKRKDNKSSNYANGFVPS